MFEDERRPLYKLCRKLALKRIEKSDYWPHINKAAKAKWRKNLSEQTFDYIMAITERHPYYVNYLCDEIWSEEDEFPNVESVEKAWRMIVEEERSDLLKDFFSLSENQKKIMIYVSNYDGKDLYSREVSRKMDLPTSSVRRALTVLIEQDYLEKFEDQFRLIVPIYKDLLKIK